MPTDTSDDPYAEPEAAIACYEGWSGMAVTVHDLGGALKGFLGPSRQWHASIACLAVKRATNNVPCDRWDTKSMRESIAAQPRGRVQICHAGFVEVVVPVLRAGRLELVLFAGQRSAGRGLRALRDPASTPAGSRSGLPTGSRRPREIGDEEAAIALEGLRQLGARLRAWLDETVEGASAARVPEPINRQQEILRFILSEHHRGIGLIDLANHLHLSIHRAAHVVRHACGRTFVDLLTEARLRSACAMLAHTELPVPEVASRSGFGDADHFHRVFRRRMGTTPGRFRKAPVVQQP